MDKTVSPSQPIGVFDSGVGGLSVLREIRRELPNEDILYLGDQAHIPYGPRPKAEIREFAATITRFLENEGAKLIVVACNTASAAALHDLRKLFPNLPFVGMEPAVKPAAETTRTHKVGVLATPTTFSGDLYASLVERFAKRVEIFTSTCPGLVEQIESGELATPQTREILESALKPMLREGIDTIVMGCTHYPFVIPQIETITGPNVRIIDPAPAIARQTRRLLEQQRLQDTEQTRGEIRYFTTGAHSKMENLLQSLLGETASVAQVKWINNSDLTGNF